MRKITKAIYSSFIAMSMSFAASATERLHQDYLKNVYPLANGDFIVIFASSPATCTNGNNPKYLYVQVGHNGVTVDGVKAMLAVALTAFSTGKRLTVMFDDTTYSCDINRMVISD